ncbi:MAG TPA: hypothetical protein QF813_09355 [Alphaproteobacteria bacterium]|nr:hypothetical protein [Alphaproteobacteria bacterium]
MARPRDLFWTRGMDPLTIVAIVMGLAVLTIGGVLAWVLLRSRETSSNVLDAVEKLATIQTIFGERLGQMAETSAAGQGVLRKTFDERLDAIAKRVGDVPDEQGRQHGKLLEGVKERLTVIDTAQKNIAELSSQVVGLQDVLSSRRAAPSAITNSPIWCVISCRPRPTSFRPPWARIAVPTA